MKVVWFVVAAMFLSVAGAFAQQPAGTTPVAPASGTATSSGSTSCPPATGPSGTCPVQVTINNNPSPSPPAPSPSPRPAKGSMNMERKDLYPDKTRCPCSDAKKTAAIAKKLDSIVPGAHVTAADPGILTIVWDDSVSYSAIVELKKLAEQLRDSTQPPSPDSPAPKSPLIHRLTNHKAQEIAHKLDTSVPGITVAAIPNDADDALVITWDKDPLAAAVPDLLKIIDGLDAADTVGSASSHIIRLYNNRDAARIAAILNGFQSGSAKIKVDNQGSDVLVLTGSSPGSEGVIDEMKRYVAVLDLPRPEIALNLWSVQVSSGKREQVNEDAGQIRSTVNVYNSLLANSYDRGWRVITYLKNQDEAKDSKDPKWLDKSFFNYLGKRFISCSPFYQVADGHAHPTQLCFAEDGSTAVPRPNGPLTRNFLHACDKGEYCLGYTFAFDPLKASLTNLFFALAAARQPWPLAKAVVGCMESDDSTCGTTKGGILWDDLTKVATDKAGLPPQCNFALEPEPGCKNQAQKVLDEEDAAKAAAPPQEDCEKLDQTVYEELMPESTKPESISRQLSFKCFAAELWNVFASSRKTGLMRAAIADFLFHYKMSIEYPHEFVPYDLSHSADTLDSYFHPLLAAYNRDLAALLRTLQERPFKDREFRSEGIVSVSVISGNPASVDAKTANSFESTTPFTISEFLNQLKAAESSTPALLKSNLTVEEANAIVAAFNVQKPTTINIGRDLSLTATAFSLATGSAADLKVVMASKDDGQPQQTFQGGSKNDINPSRVAQHTVDTTVRVESTKLFELSSLSARLSYRGNSWPVPIIGELPWIGPAFRWPGSVHKVFHRSFAVISAVIVPNASDLALGMPFTTDRILGIPGVLPEDCKEPAGSCAGPGGTCVPSAKQCPDSPARQPQTGTQSARFSGNYHAKTLALDSLRELPPQVREFHKEKLRCFIRNDNSDRCQTLSLENFPEDGKPGDKNAEEP